MRTTMTQAVLRYFVAHYPYADDLDRIRLTRLVFFTDWWAAQTYGQPITAIRWYFAPYGPETPTILHVATHDRTLRVRATVSAFGYPRTLVELRRPAIPSSQYLTQAHQAILDRVIAETQDLTWSGFVALLWQQYPMATQHRDTVLDLADLARQAARCTPSSAPA
jgi:hypothetical protein